jgi:hypothetical protein
MSSPASLIVNNQLGSKAYRLDHSLQTHFSEPVMRQNSLRFLAPAGDGIAQRVLSMADARPALGMKKARAVMRPLASGSKMAPSERRALASVGWAKALAPCPRAPKKRIEWVE